MIVEGYVRTKTSMNLDVDVWMHEKGALLPNMHKYIGYLLQ